MQAYVCTCCTCGPCLEVLPVQCLAVVTSKNTTKFGGGHSLGPPDSCVVGRASMSVKHWQQPEMPTGCASAKR